MADGAVAVDARRVGQFVANWDRGDIRRLRSSPYLIPRLCQINVTHLEFLRAIPELPESLILVVRMSGPQVSSRTLRCDKIISESSGFFTSLLDVSFSIQYAHNVRIPNNVLQIFICRRTTRTRTLKTIAHAVIRMEDVIQYYFTKRLILHAPGKSEREPVCRVEVSVSSISMTDEFERQTRNIIGDYRDDINFLSDEEWDLDEERSSQRLRDPRKLSTKEDSARHLGSPPPDDGQQQRGGIRSKLSNLLRRRRRPQLGEVSELPHEQLVYEYETEPVPKDNDDAESLSDDFENFAEHLLSDDGAIDSEPEDSDISMDEHMHE